VDNVDMWKKPEEIPFFLIINLLKIMWIMWICGRKSLVLFSNVQTFPFSCILKKSSKNVDMWENWVVRVSSFFLKKTKL